MAILRALLFLILCVVGGYLGHRFGRFYADIPTIHGLIGQNPALVIASITGYTIIGVLIGGFASTKLSAHLTHLAASLREMPTNDKFALLFGALVGLVLTILLGPILNQVEDQLLRATLTAGMACVLIFLTTQAASSMRDELRKLLPPYGVTPPDEKATLRQAKILDTNIIIDGRISDICRSGFIEGVIYVPGFVLEELQTIADSGDSLKRARGRRGLDILNAMQKEFSLVVRTYDHLAAAEPNEAVDSRLVRLAKALDATIVTNDANLAKVAGLQNVRVMNVNELANSLKPVVLPGEDMSVLIIREGKEPGQGIAYLEDGTMVVVENGRPHVGESVQVLVTSVLQTVNGKMIFTNLREVAEREREQLDRNIQTYFRGGSGRRRAGDRPAESS